MSRRSQAAWGSALGGADHVLTTCLATALVMRTRTATAYCHRRRPRQSGGAERQGFGTPAQCTIRGVWVLQAATDDETRGTGL
jgi:hypothetical protein